MVRQFICNALDDLFLEGILGRWLINGEHFNDKYMSTTLYLFLSTLAMLELQFFLSKIRVLKFRRTTWHTRYTIS